MPAFPLTLLLRLDDELNLKLPSGQMRNLAVLLPRDLKRRNNNESEMFQAALVLLSALMAKQ